MKIGYARVSSKHQNLDRQISALEAAGCDRIYREKQSGKTTKNRPQLARALAALGKGDILILAEWDRATRSMVDGIAIMSQLNSQGAFLKVLDRAHLDLTTPVGRGVLALLSAIYEEERERIVARAAQGRRSAKARGVRSGPKPKVVGDDLSTTLAMHQAGHSNAAIGRALGRHHTTIGRALASHRKQPS